MIRVILICLGWGLAATAEDATLTVGKVHFSPGAVQSVSLSEFGTAFAIEEGQVDRHHVCGDLNKVYFVSANSLFRGQKLGAPISVQFPLEFNQGEQRGYINVPTILKARDAFSGIAMLQVKSPALDVLRDLKIQLHCVGLQSVGEAKANKIYGYPFHALEGVLVRPDYPDRGLRGALGVIQTDKSVQMVSMVVKDYTAEAGKDKDLIHRPLSEVATFAQDAAREKGKVGGTKGALTYLPDGEAFEFLGKKDVGIFRPLTTATGSAFGLQLEKFGDRVELLGGPEELGELFANKNPERNIDTRTMAGSNGFLRLSQTLKLDPNNRLIVVKSINGIEARSWKQFETQVASLGVYPGALFELEIFEVKPASGSSPARVETFTVAVGLQSYEYASLMKRRIALALANRSGVSGGEIATLERLRPMVEEMFNAMMHHAAQGTAVLKKQEDQRRQHFDALRSRIRAVYNELYEEVREGTAARRRPRHITPLFENLNDSINRIENWLNGAQESAATPGRNL